MRARAPRAQESQPRRRGDGRPCPGAGEEWGSPGYRQGPPGPELTEYGSGTAARGESRWRTKLSDSVAVMNCCGGEERSSSLPLFLPLPLMNEPEDG